VNGEILSKLDRPAPIAKGIRRPRPAGEVVSVMPNFAEVNMRITKERSQNSLNRISHPLAVALERVAFERSAFSRKKLQRRKSKK
jgi:hypothetical protein